MDIDRWRSWRTLWMDRRKLPQRLIAASLFTGLCAWVLVSAAVGQAIINPTDAPVKVAQLVSFQWWIIAGMLGLVGVLVSFIIVGHINTTKTDVRDLWDKKLGKEEHKGMDHSTLCAKCRDAHISVGGKP